MISLLTGLIFRYLHCASFCSYLSIIVVSTDSSNYRMLLPHGALQKRNIAQLNLDNTGFKEEPLKDTMGDLAAEEEEARQRAERLCC